MALDKNDGVFLPSIEGVVGGKTSQVDGMNGLLNDLIGNDNYLKDKKLDRGNYNGTAEKLNNGINSTWGGEYVGDIQDSIVKEVNKHYRDRINGKGYRCIKSGGSNITTNTTEYFEPCNVIDNLDKLQNLDVKRFTVFYAGPSIPSSDLISGTSLDGVIKLNYSSIPSNYVVVGHDCYCDTPEVENFTYGSIAQNGCYRFKRLNTSKGFSIYAYAIKLK